MWAFHYVIGLANPEVCGQSTHDHGIYGYGLAVAWLTRSLHTFSVAEWQNMGLIAL